MHIQYLLSYNEKKWIGKSKFVYHHINSIANFNKVDNHV